MRRLSLIAGREIAAYAGVPSFWVALLMGPLLMVLTGLAAKSVIPTVHAPEPRYVSVVAVDPAMQEAANAALILGGQREGRETILRPNDITTLIRVVADDTGTVNVRMQGEALPSASVTMLRDGLAAVERRERLRAAGVSADVISAAEEPQVVVHEPPLPPAAPSDTGRIGRFAVMMMLWMTLIGALGMLLQAIVRERANRALEGLLASSRASEIVFGKLAGVGALSLLVLAVWLGAGAAIAASPLAGVGSSLSATVIRAFANPLALCQAVVMYVLAFAMYGSALIGLGAVARDVPSAQNLSRPVFGVLLLVFFVGLGKFAGLGVGLDWLGWVPLFTPFVTLMAPPGSISAFQMAVQFAGMLAATVGFGWLATQALTSEGMRPPRAWVERSGDRRAGGRRATDRRAVA